MPGQLELRNEKVLGRAQTEWNIIKCIKEQEKFVGHIITDKDFKIDSLSGREPSTAGPGVTRTKNRSRRKTVRRLSALPSRKPTCPRPGLY
ncbi:hypothetical protein E2C01_057507 [Portunus trituberculatus]|uniref:Uncharacterized protein n=1 Tax=Portunus trituberculatus TaxID=210409 RepID=A0A5B7H0I5_PORTR|nr:hypothetical protein [Portunus trituberculatus]